jgi:hypothetical protein
MRFNNEASERWLYLILSSLILIFRFSALLRASQLKKQTLQQQYADCFLCTKKEIIILFSVDKKFIMRHEKNLV